MAAREPGPVLHQQHARALRSACGPIAYVLSLVTAWPSWARPMKICPPRGALPTLHRGATQDATGRVVGGRSADGVALFGGVESPFTGAIVCS